MTIAAVSMKSSIQCPHLMCSFGGGKKDYNIIQLIISVN